MRREGGVDGGDHVVLASLVRVLVLHAVRVRGLHVSLHRKQRAVGRELGLVVDVHAAKVCSTRVVAVHDTAVGEDVGEGAFLAKLAVALCEVLARRALSDGLVRVQKRTRLPSLTRALPVEFAGHV